MNRKQKALIFCTIALFLVGLLITPVSAHTYEASDRYVLHWGDGIFSTDPAVKNWLTETLYPGIPWFPNWRMAHISYWWDSVYLYGDDYHLYINVVGMDDENLKVAIHWMAANRVMQSTYYTITDTGVYNIPFPDRPGGANKIQVELVDAQGWPDLSPDYWRYYSPRVWYH